MGGKLDDSGGPTSSDMQRRLAEAEEREAMAAAATRKLEEQVTGA